MSEEKTIYCGNGQKKGDTWLKASICLDKIPAEHTFEYQGKKYVKVNINLRDQLDDYGNDVAISVDTWKLPAFSDLSARGICRMYLSCAVLSVWHLVNGLG